MRAFVNCVVQIGPSFTFLLSGGFAHKDLFFFFVVVVWIINCDVNGVAINCCTVFV